MPDPDMGDFSPVNEIDGTFGKLAMGVDEHGDVRFAFHEYAGPKLHARELDLGSYELAELGDALDELAIERDQLADDLDPSGVYDDRWFGGQQEHKVELQGNGMIVVTFGAEDPDPWTLRLDPPHEADPADPSDEDYDDTQLLVDAIDEVLRETDVERSRPPGPPWSGSFSDAELALLLALRELGVGILRAWDAGAHPRNPKGPGGGRFRSLVDRLKDAIEEHRAGGGEGHPFDGFSREQLRRVAKTRGLDVGRGESRDDIAKKLLDHLDGPAAPAPVKEVKKAAPKVAKPEVSVPKVAAPAPAKARATGRDLSSGVDYKGLPATYNPKTSENDALKAIIGQQGFAGHPQVVTGADFDSAVQRGEVRETWRGLSQPVGSVKAEDLAEQYRTGAFHVGLGINGDGSYVAMNKADGQYYGSTLLRIGLHKDAKVISADDLDAEMDAYFAAKAGRKSAQLRALDEKLLKDLAKARTARARADIRRKYRNDIDGLDPDRSIALQRDPGIFAALRGYDAIEIPQDRSPDKHHEMIILNRTATIVQKG